MKNKSKIIWAYAPIALLIGGLVVFLCSMTQSKNGLMTSAGQVIAAISIVLIFLSVIVT